MILDYIRSLLLDYKDFQLCDLLEFGFPIEFEGERSEILQNIEKKKLRKFQNHKGAEEYPDEM